MDLAESATKSTMQSLQNMIMDWKAQIPQHLLCPALKFWEYAATLYLHECVLHTPGNKQSFTAPYTAERLSVTDFPKPVVTPDHIKSLTLLRDSAHALIDLFTDLDNAMITSLPALLFASRVTYSEYVLVKLYLATTAYGNTYGAFVDPNSIMLNEYLQKAIKVRETVRRIDPHCGTAKILSMPLRLKEWSDNYGHVNLPNGVHLQDEIYETTFDYDWNNVSSGFELLASGESGFMGSFSDFDVPVTQSWTS